MNIYVPTPREGKNLSIQVIGVSHHFTEHEDVRGVILNSILPSFLPRLHEISSVVPPGYLQLIRNAESDKTYDYFVGLTVSDVSAIPEKMESTSVHFKDYLAFPFKCTGDQLGDFINTIYADWFPQHADEYTIARSDHVQWFKSDQDTSKYEFDPETSIDTSAEIEGEVWVPVKLI